MRPIALVGYMGCGKSYWGKKLANYLNWRFVDLDEWLEENKLSTSIGSYINEKGELLFRKKEREALKELADINEQIVLSTGGGTPCYYNNMDLLNANFKTLYLDCSIKLLTNRLLQQKAHRPLIAHVPDAELKEFVAKHLFERRHFYSQASSIIKADELELETLLDVIKS
jgi:shikimate kinase